MLPPPLVSDIEGAPAKNVQTDGNGFYRVNKGGVRWGVKVKDVVAMLPTPNASDCYSANMKDNHDIKRMYLRGWVATAGNPTDSQTGQPTGKESRLRLAPEFTEWMMGLPKGYTDLPTVQS
jgi:hypothetical protein